MLSGVADSALRMERLKGDSMDLVMIANSWSAAVSNPTSKHHIAQALAAAGHSVLWVEGAGMRRPSIASGRDWRRSIARLVKAASGAVKAQGSDRIWVLSPLVVPLPSISAVRAFNSRMMLARIISAMKRLGFARPALVNYVPTFHGVMERWRRTAGPAAVAVYHCVDRWDAFDRYHSAVMAECDRRCCAAADLVVASSRELEERCRRFSSRVHCLPHGVRHDLFSAPLRHGAKRPADMPGGKVIGFMGLLSEWVDQELLLLTAAECRDATVMLIGEADVNVSRLAAARNVLLAGPRPFAALPAYVANFSVGVIPFVVNELTRAVNPVKLLEMLAAGCPVVSTALPEVGKEGVWIGNDREEFVAHVRRLLDRSPTREEKLAMSQSVEDCTWERRAARLLEMIRGEPA